MEIEHTLGKPLIGVSEEKIDVREIASTPNAVTEDENAVVPRHFLTRGLVEGFCVAELAAG